MSVVESGQKICVTHNCVKDHGPEVVSCKSQYVSRETFVREIGYVPIEVVYPASTPFID
jgi:hypothetical protein